MLEILSSKTEEPQVLLRELATASDDIAYFVAIEEDRSHLEQHGNEIASKYPRLRDVTRARLQNQGDKLRMGIWNDERFVGMIGATFSEDKTEAEIGYWLRASATGKGYATVAVRALTAHLEATHERIFAEVHRDNHASGKVLQRAGYSLVASAEREWGTAMIFEPIK